MNTMGRVILVGGVLAWSADSGLAQTPEPVTPDLARLSDGKSAQVFNRALAVATEGGRTVVRLDARAGEGGVLLEGIQLGEGVIEVDLKGKDVAQQSFLGVAFHVVDWTTLDAVYFRPFNFRAAEPAAAIPLRPVRLASRPHVAAAAERAAGAVRAGDRPSARSQWLVPRAHRPRGRPGRGLRERRREAEPGRRGPGRGEERRRRALRRQRIRRRVRRSPGHGHGARGPASGEHAEVARAGGRPSGFRDPADLAAASPGRRSPRAEASRPASRPGSSS